MCLLHETIAAAMKYEPSSESWERLHRCQILLLEKKWERQAAEEEKVQQTVIPPPSVEEMRAAADAEAARARVDDRIEQMRKRYAPAAPECGHTCTLVLRLECASGSVEDSFWRPPCRRSSCAYCWRERQVENLQRMKLCLLPWGKAGQRPRLYHVGECRWQPREPRKPGERRDRRESWESYDKAIRRAAGSNDVGRLRIRMDDNRVLVIGEMPWPGSRPVSPGEAVDLAIEAIADMHKDRNSYRQLGRWYAPRERKRKLLACVHGGIDLAETARQLAALGTRSRLIRSKDMSALLWRADSLEAADALLEKVCPSMDSSKTAKGRSANSDKASADDSEPSDDDPLAYEPSWPVDDPGST